MSGIALPIVGSPEFHAKRAELLDKVTNKYAYVAELGGMVLKAHPLKLRPMQDHVFNRVTSAAYCFSYRGHDGKARKWSPKMEEMLAAIDDPECDQGLTIVERVEFLPGQPEVTEDAEDDCRVLNLWQPPKWNVRGDLGEPGVFLDHVRYLFDQDEAAVGHVLDFIAHAVQKPVERIGHALLLTSEAKGIGKSTLGLAIRRLVGEGNARVAQSKDLKSQFDGWIMGKSVVQVDEVYEAGNWDLTNKLKPLITEETISVNVKYGPQVEIKNYARLVMFSNHAAPLSIEDGDRRYFVFNSKAQPREAGYYQRVYEFLESSEGMNALFTFFMGRDLTGFNPHLPPPMTAAKAEMVAVSGNPLEVYVAEASASGHLFQQLGREFTWDALGRLLQKDGWGAHAKNTRELRSALEAAGIGQARRTSEGRRVSLYVLPEVACFVDTGAHPF